MSDLKWETVYTYDCEALERFKVQSGYIYRSTIWEEVNGQRCSLTQSMVMVYNTPLKVKT